MHFNIMIRINVIRPLVKECIPKNLNIYNFRLKNFVYLNLCVVLSSVEHEKGFITLGPGKSCLVHMSMKNMLGSVEHEKGFITLGPGK